MNRREFLGAAALVPAWMRPLEAQSPAVQLTREALVRSRSAVVLMDASDAVGVDLIREWNGPICRPRITNHGSGSVRVKEVVLFDASVSLPASTALYGEGFQMLTQTGGTVAVPIDYSQYTDARHYRIPTTSGTRAYYGLLTLTPPGEDTSVLAFTSCDRFVGRLHLGPTLTVVVDTEGLELRPGETWQLEELTFASGSDRETMLAAVADRLASHHPRLAVRQAQGERVPPPTGWCSWYCFGPRVTAQQVLDNLDVIAKSFPALTYVQIDDGYQAAMGDWLDTGAAFGGNVRSVLDQIRRRGFEPAIWVAPFVAEEGSAVFKQHPDWFITDAAGAPLRSDRVTFGGWRRGPWYAVDGTHPAAQAHLERVFRTMRTEWGCTYFKLDANFWGAMHGGRFHDARATRVEAYRRGMDAIRRGAGDAFLLGCNHPIWPSVGMIHGSRSSNDIKRAWDRVASTARQNLSRNWQNGRLWWNDPDAVVLAGELSDEECRFHATAIYASGGMVLSGDDLTAIPPARAAMLRKLLPPTGVAAQFEDATLRVGTVRLPKARMICLFNWDDTPRRLSFDARDGETITDYWTDRTLDAPMRGTMAIEMPPRSARLMKIG